MYNLSKALFIALLLIALLLFQSCAREENSIGTVIKTETENDVKFTELYNLPMGFDEVEFKSISKDTILMLNGAEISKFNLENFISKEIGIGTIGDDKAELFLQFTGDKSTSEAYEIKSITAKGNKVTINLRDNGIMMIKPSDGFGGIFKTVIIVELDKEFLSEDMEVDVEISELSN